MKITLNDLSQGGVVIFVEEEHSNQVFDVLTNRLELSVTEFLRRATESPAHIQASMKYTSMLVVQGKWAHELAELLSGELNGALTEHNIGMPSPEYVVTTGTYDPLEE